MSDICLRSLCAIRMKVVQSMGAGQGEGQSYFGTVALFVCLGPGELVG